MSVDKFKLKVIVRLRPYLIQNKVIKEEVEEDKLFNLNFDTKVLTIPNLKSRNQLLEYKFDSLYDGQSSQTNIFNNDVIPLLSKSLNGTDATIFCYGMTGAGKTYTLQGNNNNPGILFLTVEYLLKKIDLKLSMSYMEIYNELVFDLLTDRHYQPGGGLSIRETIDRKIYVSDLSEVSIDSMSTFHKLFDEANKHRATASTKLNDTSSRSHSILSLNLDLTPNEPDHLKLKVKINLIDLAGSEDNRQTQNIGDRMKESQNINTSLFVLGKVVDALANRAIRVPYRDSKLTRILQSSLNGGGMACLILNLRPGKSFWNESVKALNFAGKCNTIEMDIPKLEIKQVRSRDDDDRFELDKKLRLDQGFIKRRQELAIKMGKKVDLKAERLSPLVTQRPRSRLSNLPTNNQRPSSRLSNFSTNNQHPPSRLSLNTSTTKSINLPNSVVNYPVMNQPLNRRISIYPETDELVRAKHKLDFAIQYVDQAHKLYDNNKLEDCLKMYRQAHKLVPDDEGIKEKIRQLCHKIHQDVTPPNIRSKGYLVNINHNGNNKDVEIKKEREKVATPIKTGIRAKMKQQQELFKNKIDTKRELIKSKQEFIQPIKRELDQSIKSQQQSIKPIKNELNQPIKNELNQPIKNELNQPIKLIGKPKLNSIILSNSIKFQKRELTETIDLISNESEDYENNSSDSEYQPTSTNEIEDEIKNPPIKFNKPKIIFKTNNDQNDLSKLNDPNLPILTILNLADSQYIKAIHTIGLKKAEKIAKFIKDRNGIKTLLELKLIGFSDKQLFKMLDDKK